MPPSLIIDLSTPRQRLPQPGPPGLVARAGVASSSRRQRRRQDQPAGGRLRRRHDPQLPCRPARRLRAARQLLLPGSRRSGYRPAVQPGGRLDRGPAGAHPERQGRTAGRAPRRPAGGRLDVGRGGGLGGCAQGSPPLPGSRDRRQPAGRPGASRALPRGSAPEAGAAPSRRCGDRDLERAARRARRRGDPPPARVRGDAQGYPPRGPRRIGPAVPSGRAALPAVPRFRSRRRGVDRGEPRLDRGERAPAAAPLLGPHRDELEILWGGHDIRRVASAGERKSLSLLLLAAHGRTVEAADRSPVYLLDDADAELAPPTHAAVWKVFQAGPSGEPRQLFASSNRPQVWLTLEVGKVWEMEKGRLSLLS